MAATKKKPSEAFYDRHVNVWVFCPTDRFPDLKLADLLVYSYMAGAVKVNRGKVPSGNRVASNTGLARGTVAKVLDRLAEHGLLVEGEPVPRDEWFAKRDKKSPHWADGYQFWKMLVPCEGSPLTVSDAAVYSYILHRYLSGRQPSRWTHRYVATILRIDEKTVAKSLERLAALNLFQLHDDEWLVAEALVGSQNEWFKVKEDEKAGVASVGGFVPESAPLIESVRPVKSSAPSFDDHDGTEFSASKPKPVQVEAPDQYAPREPIAPFDAWMYLRERYGIDQDDFKANDVFGRVYRRIKSSLKGDDWRDVLVAAYEPELKRMKGDADVISAA